MSMDVEKYNKSAYLDSQEKTGRSPFHLRLSLLLGKKFKSVRAFALAAHLSQTGLQRIFNGGEPTLSTLVALAQAADVSVEWLATGRGAWPSYLPVPTEPATAYGVHEETPSYETGKIITDTFGQPVKISNFVFIPIYNIRASAGHNGIWDSEQIVDTLAFRRDWIKASLDGAHTESLVAAMVSGDSMEPTLRHRDKILVDRSDTALSDDIYVLNLDGSVYVRRLQRLPDGCISVISDNQATFPAFKIPADRVSNLVIGGRVRAFIRTI